MIYDQHNDLKGQIGLTIFFSFFKLLKLAKQHIARTCSPKFQGLIRKFISKSTEIGDVDKPKSMCKVQTSLHFFHLATHASLFSNLSSPLRSSPLALVFPPPSVVFLGNSLTSHCPNSPFKILQ